MTSPSRPSPSGPQLRKGQLLGGRFEVRDKAGADRFAIDLVGLDRQNDEKVLIRVVRPGVLANDRSRQETLERLDALVGFGGRFLPGLNHVGIEETMLFVVEDIPRGTSLRGLLKHRKLGERRLSPDEALLVGTRLEAALSAIPAGSWHGDVNPGHIWISRDGLCLSGAFLIPSLPPRALEAVLAHDPSTARRFAPEVGRGEGSRASDLYAVAHTLYEAIAGEMAPGPGMPPPDEMGELGRVLSSMMKVEPGRRPADANPLLNALAAHAKRPLKKLDPGAFQPEALTPPPPAPAPAPAPTPARAPAPAPAPAPQEEDEWDDATSVYSGEEAAAAIQQMEAAGTASWESESTDADSPVGRIESPVMDVDTLTGARIAVGAEPSADEPADGDEAWDNDATQQVDLDALLANPEILPQESIPTPLPPSSPAQSEPQIPAAAPVPAEVEELEMEELDLDDVVESAPARKRPLRPAHKPDLDAMDLKPIPRARRAESMPPAAAPGAASDDDGVLFDDSMMGEFEPTDPGGAIPGMPKDEHQPFGLDDFDEPSIPPDAPDDLPAPQPTPPQLQDTVAPGPRTPPAPKPARRPKKDVDASMARKTIIGALVAGILFICLAIGYQIYQQQSADDAREQLLRERLQQIQLEEQPTPTP